MHSRELFLNFIFVYLKSSNIKIKNKNKEKITPLNFSIKQIMKKTYFLETLYINRI